MPAIVCDEDLTRADGMMIGPMASMRQAFALCIAMERERCAKIAEDWLATFSERGPTTGAVSAQKWANDAVQDIIDAIRKPHL